MCDCRQFEGESRLFLDFLSILDKYVVKIEHTTKKSTR
ncbi:MAG: Unknown protein [uncultured Thiotrichaceae bacterium]|uniref:Uncharacterized protein n=1 Tax=uncultured Thiotrichaceae bacterium TaxID=298394 RepID=A0A6S6T6V0_9GAMM|nr:MAG: Unknown protein [uncultured Thiotrichaceae bacterium]